MSDRQPAKSVPGPSRRKVLSAIGLGVGTAAAGGPAALAQVRSDDREGRDRGTRSGRSDTNDTNEFSRIFPGLPAFAEPSPELREALRAIGAPGGIMDAADDLDAGPIQLVTDPSLSAGNQNNPANTAGTTFVGQFIDHDLTRDAGSRLGRPVPLRRSTNLRSARFDLDSVYGGGPNELRELYEADDQFRFRVESGGQFEDLPRDETGSAIIGDPRNDENLMISGLHVAMLLFHNAVLERVRSSGLSGEAAFLEARRQVQWHYQWIVVHESLPQFVGTEMTDTILREGAEFFTDTPARIPVEFQTSAYRFGHSLIRPSYRANLAGDDGEPFFGFVFDPGSFDTVDPNDMSGGRRAPRRFIDWQTFFDFGDGEVKPNKRVDTKLSTPLFQLPMRTIASDRSEDVGPTSLATRNLLRHITWEVPSGQRVASEMGAPALAAGDLADFGSFGSDLDTSTPLWIYCLREADVMADGEHLGPVGGRIVGEVFVQLLRLDDESYLAEDPSWRPTLPSRESGEFAMVDLLTLAGVDPTSRAAGPPVVSTTPSEFDPTVQATAIAASPTETDRPDGRSGPGDGTDQDPRPPTRGQATRRR